ncbi:MAG TPA: MBL fold metallo-hydrolase, partial [Cryptosporangiaceae bacterium]|nr:MBL fold metallo-hydrolase [Cryptosporangiaceae bacterium]
MEQLSQNLYLFTDTCNVYVLRHGDEATLIDFGTGDVLDHLERVGIRNVTHVLMTHHHRDQGQGLDRAVSAGARIWVPAAERELFADVEQHWESRVVWNNY